MFLDPLEDCENGSASNVPNNARVWLGGEHTCPVYHKDQHWLSLQISRLIHFKRLLARATHAV